MSKVTLTRRNLADRLRYYASYLKEHADPQVQAVGFSLVLDAQYVEEHAELPNPTELKRLLTEVAEDG